MNNISVTDKAIKEVLYIAKDQNLELDEIVLRVRVVGGGCAGFMTKLDLDVEWDEKKDNLKELSNGVRLCVDKRSAMYLENATVDFHEDLNKRGFVVNNPLAKTTCGCGSSYSL